MVSTIEPDRYANTGYSVKDTSLEINEMIYQRSMSLPGSERVRMGMEMTESAISMVWCSIPPELSANERRDIFIERLYGREFAASVKGKLPDITADHLQGR